MHEPVRVTKMMHFSKRGLAPTNDNTKGEANKFLVETLAKRWWIEKGKVVASVHKSCPAGTPRDLV